MRSFTAWSILLVLAALLAVAATAEALTQLPGTEVSPQRVENVLAVGDCAYSPPSESSHWEQRQLEEAFARWLTGSSPSALEPRPSLSCLRISTPLTTNDFPESMWCAPMTTARISWAIEGGAAPLRVTIGEMHTNGDRGHVELTCESLHEWFADPVRRDHQIVSVDVMVTDALGKSTTEPIEVGMVSSAPTRPLESVSVTAGVSDIHVFVGPWPYMFGDVIGEELAGLVAVARFREVGEQSWRYLTPLPPPPQSGCGYWCLVPHATDLEPDTAYELQAAWMWHGRLARLNGTSYLYVDREAPLPGDWWHSWTEPEALDWSEVQQFRTFGDLEPSAEATSDTIRVTWPASNRTIHALAYSPDWPGVIWADSDNSYRWRRRAELDEGKPMSALIGGLPPDTKFEVELQTALPWRFAPAPSSIVQVRTQSDASVHKARRADPGDVNVRLVDDTLTVEWTNLSPAVYASAELHRLPDGRGSVKRGKRVAVPRPSEWDQLHGQIERRVQTVFAELAPGTRWRLFVNRTPGNTSKRGDSTPFLCMVWDISVPPDHPVAHLDRYLNDGRRVGVDGVSTSHIKDPRSFWQGCLLAEPTGE